MVLNRPELLRCRHARKCFAAMKLDEQLTIYKAPYWSGHIGRSKSCWEYWVYQLIHVRLLSPAG